MEQKRSAGQRIGFVPTMGALHRGHLYLIGQARQVCENVVCSIFVNPTQFNDAADFRRYPRTQENDITLLAEAGCDFVFTPEVEEVYPDGQYKSIDYQPGALGERLEGQHRPGHFSGMAAVVKRLFDLAKPDMAFFGQKDYQQLRIVQDMVRFYNLPIRIVAVPTVREPSGLALSSRNTLLSAEERVKAPLIFQTLSDAKENVLLGESLQQAAYKGKVTLENAGYTVDYFDICSAETLQPVEYWNQDEPLLISTAVHAGPVRLIDNVLIG